MNLAKILPLASKNKCIKLNPYDLWDGSGIMKEIKDLHLTNVIPSLIQKMDQIKEHQDHTVSINNTNY